MSNQKLVVIQRDDKNVAVVNLHGKNECPLIIIIVYNSNNNYYHQITGATLQSWKHDGTEMIFVR